MLSSLLQQKGDIDIVFNIGHLKGNGKPSTEDVVSFFRDRGLRIVTTTYDDVNDIKFRGLVRNDQIKNCKTDFILFVDTDMVYHPEYFMRLSALIESDPEYKDHDGVLKAGRFSNPIDPTDELVDSYVQDEPVVIDNAWETVDVLDKIKKSNVGAGYFQLVNMRTANHEGLYVAPESNRDYDWDEKFSKCNSDRQFRKRIGNVKALPKWFSQNEIHLNHVRDNMVGHHLDTQR
jgi:glycosyltransferase involved in cell wall biosynthesis